MKSVEKFAWLPKIVYHLQMGFKIPIWLMWYWQPVFEDKEDEEFWKSKDNEQPFFNIQSGEPLVSSRRFDEPVRSSTNKW